VLITSVQVLGPCSFVVMSAVLVRGFDYGTTDEQITGHMSSAGIIENLEMLGQGSACITYSSTEEAEEAVKSLNQTIISGNSRYLDVASMDPDGFLAGHNIDTGKANQFLALNPEQQQAIMAKGSLSTARDPTAVLASRIKQVVSAGMGSANRSFGSMASGHDGKCAVFMRGFDFGTTEEQIEAHMSGAGSIQSVQMLDQGTACVNYSSAKEAKAAAQQFNETTIPGNSRYLDVFLLDPEEFLAGYNIDNDKAMQFMAMDPQKQQFIMEKGSLSTARDPNAVLTIRMRDAKGGGRGSVGSAQMGGSNRKCAVFVRGFDFGTTDDQIAAHMGSQNVQMLDAGTACVNYSSANEAKAAAREFNETIISGNTRYLDVFCLDPDEFLAGYNIDREKAMSFLAMSPQQQQSIMEKGSLSTARDPNAVLATRMKGAKGGGKGSSGPAQGRDGRGGPYGGDGKGGMSSHMEDMFKEFLKWKGAGGSSKGDSGRGGSFKGDSGKGGSFKGDSGKGGWSKGDSGKGGKGGWSKGDSWGGGYGGDSWGGKGW